MGGYAAPDVVHAGPDDHQEGGPSDSSAKSPTGAAFANIRAGRACRRHSSRRFLFAIRSICSPALSCLHPFDCWRCYDRADPRGKEAHGSR
jgi:hypothetical protein